MDRTDINSPKKKNPCGKFIGTGQKQIIINLYKDFNQQIENPENPRLNDFVKEEHKFWKIDFIIDEILEEEPDEGDQHILTIGIGDTSGSECSDFDSEYSDSE